MATLEILCTRCRTPFPAERGTPAVTCSVCGQLRPDLDMMLDDEDDMDEGPDLPGAELKEQLVAEDGQAGAAKSHLVIAAETDSRPAPARPFISTNERGSSEHTTKVTADSLTHRVGPVVLAVAPLLAGMAGAMTMLSQAPDFSKGSLYAVGTLFVVIFMGSLSAGLMAAKMCYLVRLRWTILLRIMFLAAVGAVAYFGVRELPSHVQVRENAMPGIMVKP